MTHCSGYTLSVPVRKAFCNDSCCIVLSARRKCCGSFAPNSFRIWLHSEQLLPLQQCRVPFRVLMFGRPSRGRQTDVCYQSRDRSGTSWPKNNSSSLVKVCAALNKDCRGQLHLRPLLIIFSSRLKRRERSRQDWPRTVSWKTNI